MAVCVCGKRKRSHYYRADICRYYTPRCSAEERKHYESSWYILTFIHVKKSVFEENQPELLNHLQSERWFQVCRATRLFLSENRLLLALFLDLVGCMMRWNVNTVEHRMWCLDQTFDCRCHNSECVCRFWWTIVLNFNGFSWTLKSNN